jgi:hypothetical protein
MVCSLFYEMRWEKLSNLGRWLMMASAVVVVVTTTGIEIYYGGSE